MKVPIFRTDKPLFIKKDDKRYKKYKKEIKTNGFSGTELWNLDWTIMCFILPRIKAYRKGHIGYPGSYDTMEDWHKDLDKIVSAVEWYVEDDWRKQEDDHKEGFRLLHKHFMGLWD